MRSVRGPVRRSAARPTSAMPQASTSATNSKLLVSESNASAAPATAARRRREPGRREPHRIHGDGEERGEEVAPRHVRPVPGPRREDEPDECELGADGGHRRRVRQLPEKNSHEHDTQRHRQRVAALREQDERVLRAQPENLVDDPRCGDVGRADPVVRDRVRMPDRDDAAERREIALLVEPAGEHDARPTARRQQCVDPEPDDEEEPIDLLDELARPRGALRTRQIVRRIHGRIVRHRVHLSAVDDLAGPLEPNATRRHRGPVPNLWPCAS